ncbi:hypothetical protein PN499_16690 [Kamptonema animale CS-326]|jgi:anti-sigma-K factor RskA|uniref:hypothetical protein n=1 Tax=Kamptonema animale TaxID=92934 RepID=UPI00232C048A|nr:hypothetical protein [Kamptonema animale]MDB9512828.1 hypothetical protein [Kamptonema animale CS-326]
MNNAPKIPDPETRARHIAKLKELCERWDKHIADLDTLSDRLEEEYQKSPLAELHRRTTERREAQQKELRC